jgi:natural product biosynthesis luciferase-like monooxygenase protein
MYSQIATLRSLWRGAPLQLRNSFGDEVAVRLFPRPVQTELPIWVTASASLDTFRRAGQIGANVLTHLAFLDDASLGERIAVYRAARRSSGFDPDAGVVSLMLHTYVDDELERARDVARGPLLDYLRSAIQLELEAAQAGGTVSGGRRLSAADASSESVTELADASCDRYLATQSLIGSVAHCEGVAHRVGSVGVDEIACLLDFGLPAATMLTGVRRLAALARAVRPPTAGGVR